MKRALVLGAGGQLGQALASRAAKSLTVAAWTRQDADITDTKLLRRKIAAFAPDIIFNCAAWARVDDAEDDAVAVLAVNGWAVLELARIATERGCTLVHFSSDFVFDGVAAGVNDESRAPHPRGVYATSKLVGEWLAAETPRHFVLRVSSLFGGALAKSSIDRLAASLREGHAVQAFSDRTVSPGYVVDVADAAVALGTSSAAPGLYHCVNSGHSTWLGVATELARLLGRSSDLVVPVEMAALHLRVPRPLNAALSNAKLAAAGVEMPTWQDALARYVSSRS